MELHNFPGIEAAGLAFNPVPQIVMHFKVADASEHKVIYVFIIHHNALKVLLDVDSSTHPICSHAFSHGIFVSGCICDNILCASLLSQYSQNALSIWLI